MEGSVVQIFVADVSGKGTPAALVTGMVRAALEGVRADAATPCALLKRIHAALFPYLLDSMFVTCFCGWWDLETGILLYANAGHDPPWHITPDGALEELWPTGSALGIEDKLELEDEQRVVAVGTTLVVYTDGLTSQRVPGGERLGGRRRARAGASPCRRELRCAGRKALVPGAHIGRRHCSNDLPQVRLTMSLAPTILGEGEIS
jgi:sigma-B regulation protein RsbU (phosphoserine phosphatase)